nr:hypothetical protein KXZ65_15625 [Pectobacterium sp. PL152]
MIGLPQSSPAVAIDGSAWERLVAFTPEPAYETERLHRLIRHALKTLASSTRSEITTGIFVYPVTEIERHPYGSSFICDMRMMLFISA